MGSRATLKVALLAGLGIAATASAGWGIVLAASKSAPPPAPTITARPSSPTSSTSASFSFGDTQSGVSFQCALDTANPSNCSSPKAYTALADGTHTFRVTAQAGGATSSPSSVSWVVSTQPPTASLTFPVEGGSYNATRWAAGCSSSGFCGSAADLAGVTQVQIAVQQSATGKWWNGSGFTTSASPLFVSATLASPGAAATAWSYSMALSSLASDGVYVATVRAVDALSRTTPPSAYAVAHFSVDRVAPPAPSLTATPDDPTFAVSATFSFSDADISAGFECSLDGGSYTACSSGAGYGNLAVGDHRFDVRAVDPAGNRSAATEYRWTVVPRGSFPVSGTLSALFYPGGAPVPVDLSISNPYTFALSVTTVEVSITGTSVPACSAAANFAVVQNLRTAVTIPAGQTRTLSQLGVASSLWPQVAMRETGANQDACRGATVSFSFAAAGTKAQ